MEFKKIILIIGIIFIIVICAGYLYTSNNHDDNSTQVNNTNNITNNTNITLNNTTYSNDEKQSYNNKESTDNEPEYGSDSYVKKWDKSQQGDGNWAYTHAQPVKKDKNGKEYKRVYDEKSGKSSWQSTDLKDK